MNLEGPVSVNSAHLSDEQLACLEDGDVSAVDLRHLEACPQCSNRLRDLRAATAAYVRYRNNFRAPLLPPPPRPWKSLDRLIAQHEEKQSTRAFRFWPVPAFAAGVCVLLVLIIAGLFLVNREHSPSARASEILARSVRTEVPGNGFISVRTQGHTLVRPAVFSAGSQLPADADMTHLRMLFAAAHYSWREPLSSRSFRDWRNSLKQKRDYVSLIQQGERRSYRVRTDDPDGILRSASLTLTAGELRPTNGAFVFEGEGTVEVAEAPEPTRLPAPSAPRSAEKTTGKVTETPVGPEDTLHVLAALDRIGADVGDPIEISADAPHHHIVVRGYGLSQQRQREIGEALESLPRVVTDFASSGTSADSVEPARREKYSTSIPVPLQQRLEAELGGAVALQAATDRILEVSASTLAQSHALELLSQNFPPQIENTFSPQDRDILRALRKARVLELIRLIARIRKETQPLLAASSNPSPSQVTDNGASGTWQAAVPKIVTCAQAVDRSLNRLLAGNYSLPIGNEILNTLPAQMEQLERAVRLQNNAEK